MIAETNISLKVPFNEKDQAKSLGARWNAESKYWYIPQGLEAAPFDKWLTNAPTATKTKPVAPISAATATQDQTLNDDIDAINAKLRDAYEMRDGDVF